MSSESVEIRVPGAPVWRLPGSLILGAVVVALISLWPFWDGLSVMWSTWLYTPEYSHGLLIPPVAAALIWQQKNRLERMRFDGSWWGVALVLVGCALLVVGQLGTVFTIVQYAYVVTLCGLVLSFLGVQPFKLVAVPFLILAFMIPLPQFAMANLSTKLQLLSSQAGVALMRAFGVSVFLEGNVIDLGGYKLQVAEACSGLRYLFPLMTLGFLMAYLYRGAWWKRGILFLSSVPITVLMNSVRVGIIGVTVEHWGIGMAEGFLHEFQGWAVFMICTGLMLAEIAALNRVGRESGSFRQLFGFELPTPTPQDSVTRSRHVPPSFLAATACLVVVVLGTFGMARPAEIFPARAALDSFPMQLGVWKGRRETLEGVYADALNLDDYLMADYVDPSGAAVNLYIPYYNSQRKGEAVHSPRSCLPGGGWQMRDFDQRSLPGVAIGGQPLRVNRAIVEMGNQRQLVYYWFQQRGRIITNEFAVKWYLFWDALTRHRTDGGMVRLVAAIPPGSSEAEADQHVVAVAALVAPRLSQYIPD